MDFWEVHHTPVSKVAILNFVKSTDHTNYLGSALLIQVCNKEHGFTWKPNVIYEWTHQVRTRLSLLNSHSRRTRFSVRELYFPNNVLNTSEQASFLLKKRVFQYRKRVSEERQKCLINAFVSVPFYHCFFRIDLSKLLLNKS